MTLGALKGRPVTVLEFESWVSDNYPELVLLARQQCFAPHREEIAQDLLHEVVEGLLTNDLDVKGNVVLSSEDKIGRLQAWKLFRWFNRALSHDAMDATKVRGNATKARVEFEAQAAVLGADSLADGRAITEARKSFNQKTQQMQAKNRAGMKSKKHRRSDTTRVASPMEGIEWLGGMTGNTRWRFQTLRDNNLFDQRAVESLRDSIRKAAARYRHFGEHGYSFTEFGQEVAR